MSNLTDKLNERSPLNQERVIVESGNPMLDTVRPTVKRPQSVVLKQLSTYLHHELFHALKAQVAKEDRKLYQVLEDAVELYIKVKGQ